jgi:hypothetical protein
MATSKKAKDEAPALITREADCRDLSQISALCIEKPSIWAQGLLLQDSASKPREQHKRWSYKYISHPFSPPSTVEFTSFYQEALTDTVKTEHIF